MAFSCSCHLCSWQTINVAENDEMKVLRSKESFRDVIIKVAVDLYMPSF